MTAFPLNLPGRVIREILPEARISGFTVQPMIQRPNAHELIIGISDDVQFGPVILFGQGGTAVEIIGDKAIALPPLNMHLAREVMTNTRVCRLLEGYRGRPAADLDSISLTLVKVSQLVSDIGDIAELDINPLVADPQGAAFGVVRSSGGDPADPDIFEALRAAAARVAPNEVRVLRYHADAVRCLAVAPGSGLVAGRHAPGLCRHCGGCEPGLYSHCYWRTTFSGDQ